MSETAKCNAAIRRCKARIAELRMRRKQETDAAIQYRLMTMIEAEQDKIDALQRKCAK